MFRHLAGGGSDTNISGARRHVYPVGLWITPVRGIGYNLPFTENRLQVV